MKRRLAPLLLVGLASCTATINESDEPALKNVFRHDFLVGAALNASHFTLSDTENCEAALVKEQFNSISPENVLKWESVHPEAHRYNFGPADNYVAFGVNNKMFIVGHNLIWHQQTPAWVFQNDAGGPVDRDTLLERMRDHIFTVVGRYKGKIKGWDVVNEALNDDGSLRPSRWLQIIGEDYLIKAYQFAHQADPKAQLYYNEYSLENAAKRAGAIALIKKLQAAGIPLAAVGLQGHYKMNWPSTAELGQTIDDLSALGVKIMITELDVDMLPAAGRSHTAEVSTNFRSDPALNPYAEGLPEAMQQALAGRYADLFGVFVKHRKQITRVTFWGVGDGDSWLNNWPIRRRTSYPLLFDRQCRPKLAFDQVIAVGRGEP
jgi:endo-1,4-beta-xylanase